MGQQASGRSRAARGYEANLLALKARHHARCLFNRNPPVPELAFRFNAGGRLLGEFRCTDAHQGYDRMVHGGVIAAIVDASMAQCLMGHGIVGYTTDLSIKYRKPVALECTATLETAFEETAMGCLHSMRCEIVQDRARVVQARGRFYEIDASQDVRQGADTVDA